MAPGRAAQLQGYAAAPELRSNEALRETRSAPAQFGRRIDTDRGRGRQAESRGQPRIAGAVRVGFHLYNTENDLDRLLDALGDNGQWQLAGRPGLALSGGRDGRQR
jgi:selenocysteine lyase/cysteine desulfurase